MIKRLDEEDAATTAASNSREEDAAAAKIQAQFRGIKDRENVVAELDALVLDGLAKPPAKKKKKKKKKKRFFNWGETEEGRKETDEAAAKIQAQFRGIKDRQKVAAQLEVLEGGLSGIQTDAVDEGNNAQAAEEEKKISRKLDYRPPHRSVRIFTSCRVCFWLSLTSQTVLPSSTGVRCHQLEVSRRDQS